MWWIAVNGTAVSTEVARCGVQFERWRIFKRLVGDNSILYMHNCMQLVLVDSVCKSNDDDVLEKEC